jgi:hypothetical protein
MGVQPSVAESDCSAVASTVNANSQDMSRICFLYREIDRIRRILPSCGVSLVRRDCNNVVAHELF